jgi:hypothetical protein
MASVNVVPLHNNMSRAVRTPLRSMPTDDQINSIPLAITTEFELSDRETRTLRQRLYAINKDHIRRYRTLREGTILMVWRIK